MSWPKETTYNDVFPWKPPDKNLTPWEERVPEDTRAKAEAVDKLYDVQAKQNARGELRVDHLLLEHTAQAIAKLGAILGEPEKEKRAQELIAEIDAFCAELILPEDVEKYEDKVIWFQEQIEKYGPRKNF